MSRRLPIWLLACVIGTLAASWLFVAISAAGRIDFLFYSQRRADVPFRVKYSDRISWLTPKWSGSGAAVGDRILSLEGQPFSGFEQEYAQVRARRHGNLYRVRLQKPDGSQIVVSAPLPVKVPFGPHRPLRWRAFDVFLLILFPALCVAVGTWVLLSRPRDWNAWYVFAILFFPQSFLGMSENFTGPVLTFAAVFQDFTQNLLFLACLCFALDFPQRFPWERRRSWLRWLVIIPLLLCLPIDAYELFTREYAAASFPAGLSPWLVGVDHVENALGIFCISFFCGALWVKYFAARADARRRLRVLVIGSQLGLWPLFLIVIRSTFLGVQVNEAAPLPVFLFALIMFMLFPLSMAYAIIVERAMDVRILLRQGTQYALARGTLFAIRAAISAFLAYTVAQAVKHHITTSRSALQLLLAAALLLLMRFAVEKRARLWLDRRFFRETYATEQVLSDLVSQAAQFTETRPLLETVSKRIADTLHVQNMVMLLRTPTGFRLQTSLGLDLPQNFLLANGSESITAMERRRGPATVYFDRPDDWLLDASDAERAALRELNAEVLLPLPGRNRLMGVMALGPKRSEQPYSKSDLQLLTSVGTQTGMALENSELLSHLTSEVAQRERMNRELEIAHEVQERLFPQHFPELPGVQVTGSCRPAQGVGGDYYDCMVTGSGRLGLAIGDVSGKGVSAALLMASLRASLRGQTMQGATDLAQVVSNVNALLYDSSASNRYATFFFGEYDPATRVIYYVNAGHNAPMLIRPVGDGEFEQHALTGGGPVVGLLALAEYEQCQLQMRSGDLLLLYTDGISEAMDPQDEEWGEDSMIAAAKRLSPLTAQEILNGLVNQADIFANGAEQHDDMTLMVMKLA